MSINGSSCARHEIFRVQYIRITNYSLAIMISCLRLGSWIPFIKHKATNAAPPPALSTQPVLLESCCEAVDRDFQIKLLPRDIVICGMHIAILCRPNTIPGRIMPRSSTQATGGEEAGWWPQFRDISRLRRVYGTHDATAQAMPVMAKIVTVPIADETNMVLSIDIANKPCDKVHKRRIVNHELVIFREYW